MSQPTDDFAEHIADLVAEKVAARLSAVGSGPASPWMTVEEAADYSRIPLGTFRGLSAAGRVRSHTSGKRHVYHRAEVDEDLLGYARDSNVTPMRKAS